MKRSNRFLVALLLLSGFSPVQASPILSKGRETALRDVRAYILPGIPVSPFMKATWYNSTRRRWTMKNKSAAQVR